LEPKQRSRLHTLNLVALCSASAVKRVTDLQTLGNTGVTVVRADGTFTFNGVLLLLFADNLGAPSIGCYLESFSTLHPCHFCLISRDKMCSTLRCKSYLRTPELYKRNTERVDTDKSFQSYPRVESELLFKFCTTFPCYMWNAF